METLRDINSLRLTGQLIHKNYDEKEKRLFFVLMLSTPRRDRDGKREYVRDFPNFTIIGDNAEAINNVLTVGKMVSVDGHLATVTAFRHEGHSTFHQVWETETIADTVIPEAGGMSENSATISGRIVRVYRNPDEGKRFYLITVATVLGTGEKENVSFAYFDRGMRLEPKVGDYAYANGFIQTRQIDEERLASMDGRRRRQRYSTSVSARNVSIVREDSEKKKGPADSEADPAPESQNGNDSDQNKAAEAPAESENQEKESSLPQGPQNTEKPDDEAASEPEPENDPVHEEDFDDGDFL